MPSPDGIFGRRYYYWKWYKGNTSEDWRCNEGRTFNSLYIPSKYDNLKEEMTHNKICTISPETWSIICVKAEQYRTESNVIRAIQSQGDELCHYGIGDGETLHREHLIALILHTDHKEMANYLMTTTRKSKGNGRDGRDGVKKVSEYTFKRKLRNFHHWNKYLREAVELYGTPMADSRISTFYVAISNAVLFESFSARFAAPTSTTTQLQIMSLCTTDGLVLELQATAESVSFYQGLLKYFDCSLVSVFGEECEQLFVGGFAPMQFINIRSICEQRMSFKVFVKAIRHFEVEIFSSFSSIVFPPNFWIFAFSYFLCSPGTKQDVIDPEDHHDEQYESASTHDSSHSTDGSASYSGSHSASHSVSHSGSYRKRMRSRSSTDKSIGTKLFRNNSSYQSIYSEYSNLESATNMDSDGLLGVDGVSLNSIGGDGNHKNNGIHQQSQQTPERGVMLSYKEYEDQKRREMEMNSKCTAMDSLIISNLCQKAVDRTFINEFPEYINSYWFHMVSNKESVYFDLWDLKRNYSPFCKMLLAEEKSDCLRFDFVAELFVECREIKVEMHGVDHLSANDLLSLCQMMVNIQKLKNEGKCKVSLIVLHGMRSEPIGMPLDLLDIWGQIRQEYFEYADAKWFQSLAEFRRGSEEDLRIEFDYEYSVKKMVDGIEEKWKGEAIAKDRKGRSKSYR